MSTAFKMQEQRRDGTPDGTPASRVSERPKQRLLGVKAAAEYLGISEYTVRQYVRYGVIPSVELPPLPPANKKLCRILIDIEDLDKLIAKYKQGNNLPEQEIDRRYEALSGNRRRTSKDNSGEDRTPYPWEIQVLGHAVRSRK